MFDRAGRLGTAQHLGVGASPATPSLGRGVAIGLRARLRPEDSPPPQHPVWGDLPAPSESMMDPWLTGSRNTGTSGERIEVDLLGDRFHVSGTVSTGTFDRFSDWLNMQSGFVEVEDGAMRYPGRDEPERRKRAMWVRLDQVVLAAQRTADQAPRPGAPIVEKQKLKVEVATTAYRLTGLLHIHAFGSMQQFLDSPDSQFLPVTDVTVASIDNSRVISRYAFAMLNRRRIVMVADDSTTADGREEQETDRGPETRWNAA
jgi:hypothetical protein